MAERTKGETKIAADPGAVMGVIADFEAYPEWASGVKKTEILERDSEGRGKKVRFEVSMMGLNGWYVLTYEYEPGDSGISWTFVEGSPIKNLEGEYSLSDAGGSTQVVYRASVEPGIPMIGFMKRKMEQQVIDIALKGLKKRVESLH
jgi:ribosome-associated toxin RatA of RatAB toxin-antitoxin module